MKLVHKCNLILNVFRKYWKNMVIICVPLLLLPLVVTGNKSMQCGYVILLVSIFWITEVMTLSVTSLIPIILFPAFGILTSSQVAGCYMKDIALMLIGGLIVAKAVEKQNLHKRFALRILKFMGPNPIFQYLGFMLSTWFLSMWISNTATTAMMLTLSDAVVQQCELMERYKDNENVIQKDEINMEEIKTVPVNMHNEELEVSNENKIDVQYFGKGLFLSIAYAATCGGIATIPGTAPNLVFYGFMQDRYKSRLNLNFGTFMLFSFPISLILVIIAWMVLCMRYVGLRSIFKRKKNPLKESKTMELINKEISSLGSFSYGEISTLIVFILLVLMWILREPGIPLLGRLFTYKNAKGKDVKYWSDAISAIVATLFVFNLPAKNPFKTEPENNERLVDWKFIEKGFPWGLIFLFGAGFALAAGCEKSGLSLNIGDFLSNINSLPHFAIIFLISLGISFLTEITSNTATLSILLPIMLKTAECIGMHPMKLGLAVTIACSFSFCLPAATPPNAIVFSTGKLRVTDMVISGFILNILGITVLSVITYYYSVPIFHTDVFPTWIKVNCSNV